MTHEVRGRQPQLPPYPEAWSSLTWSHQDPMQARISPTQPHSYRCPGAAHQALEALVSELTPCPVCSHTLVTKASLPPEACAHWSCQHPLGRSVLGVSNSLGAHGARLGKCSQGSVCTCPGRGHVGAGCVCVCLSAEARGWPCARARFQITQLPDSCQPSSCCAPSHPGPPRVGLHLPHRLGADGHLHPDNDSGAHQLQDHLPRDRPSPDPYPSRHLLALQP